MGIKGLFDLQIMLFAIIGIGIYAKKKGFISKEGKTTLTEVIINIILPCNIISAFYIEFNKDILVIGMQMLIISTLLQILCIIISKYAYNRLPNKKKMVLQYATVCSNAGFLGNPVAEEIYGQMGLLFASIYLIPQRIIMWSVGVSYFTEKPSKKELFKKIITHPCIVAVYIGLLIMIFQIQLPTSVYKTLTSIGGCTTAMTMLLIGAIIADSDLKNILTKTTVIFSLIRLVIIPLIVLMGCILFNIDKTATGVSVILAGMPAGSTTAILASKYNGDEEFAVNCVVLTTLLSIFLIPLWCSILNSI